MLSIEDFPDEIIIHIMMYLALPDRKNVRLVNHRWCDLSYSTKLTKNDVLIVNEPSDLLKLNSSSKHINIKIRDLRSETQLPFWTICGSHVRTFEVYFFSFLNLNILKEFFKNAPHLECLVISTQNIYNTNKAPITKCESYELMNLPNLLSLTLQHLEEDNSGHLHYFLNSAPKLKRLSLKYLKGDWVFSLEDTVKSFAIQQSLVLEEINFNNSLINSNFFISTLSEISSQLTSLYLSGCHLLDENCLNVIKTNFPNLNTIDLSDNSLKEAALCSFFEPLSCLTNVSLKKTETSSSVLSVLMTKNKLKSLNLSECKFLRRSHNWSLHFSASNCSNLNELRLDRVSIRNNDIETIAKNAVNLIFLSLGCCWKLTDESVQSISKHCTKLRSLILQGCLGLQDVSALNNLKELIYCDLMSCQKVADDSLSQLALPKLKEINLRGTQMQINGLSSILDNCPSVKVIELDSNMEHDVSLLRKSRVITCEMRFPQKLVLRLASDDFQYLFDHLSGGSQAFIRARIPRDQDFS